VTSDIGRKLGAMRKILIAMMVLATAAVTTAGSASAATTNAPTVTSIQPVTPDVDSAGCAAHSFCLWVNSGYSGTKFTVTFGTVSSDTWRPLGSGINDKASSLDSNRVFATGIAKNFPPSPPDVLCLQGGTRISDLRTLRWPDGTSVNDSISSFELSSSSSCTVP